MAKSEYNPTEHRADEAVLFPKKRPIPFIICSVGEKAVRMLLLCRSAQERAVVAFHLYHGLTVDQAAERAGVLPARAAELLESLGQRIESAERYRKAMKGGRHG